MCGKRSPRISKSRELCPQEGLANSPGLRRSTEAGGLAPPGSHPSALPAGLNLDSAFWKAAWARVSQLAGWAGLWVREEGCRTPGGTRQLGRLDTHGGLQSGVAWGAAPSPGPQPTRLGLGLGEHRRHSRPPGAASWPEPPLPPVRSAGAWGHPRVGVSSPRLCPPRELGRGPCHVSTQHL